MVFLVLEHWSFLDLLGSWLLFNTVSSAALRRPQTTGSSETKKRIHLGTCTYMHTQKNKIAQKFGSLVVYLHNR